MKQIKININDLFEKSEIETTMNEIDRSSIVFEMNNVNTKILEEINKYAKNREKIEMLTSEFTDIMYHERISEEDAKRIDDLFDQLVHQIDIDAPCLGACTNAIANTIEVSRDAYIKEFIRLNPQLNEEMINLELETYLEAAYELNKIFVETVGTIKRCDVVNIKQAVDLFFDQDEPTELIQIFIANTVQTLNQPHLLIDILGLTVMINEIINCHQENDFDKNLWKLVNNRFFKIDFKDDLDENMNSYN